MEDLRARWREFWLRLVAYALLLRAGEGGWKTARQIATVAPWVAYFLLGLGYAEMMMLRNPGLAPGELLSAGLLTIAVLLVNNVLTGEFLPTVIQTIGAAIVWVIVRLAAGLAVSQYYMNTSGQATLLAFGIAAAWAAIWYFGLLAALRRLGELLNQLLQQWQLLSLWQKIMVVVAAVVFAVAGAVIHWSIGLVLVVLIALFLIWARLSAGRPMHVGAPVPLDELEHPEIEVLVVPAEEAEEDDYFALLDEPDEDDVDYE